MTRIRKDRHWTVSGISLLIALAFQIPLFTAFQEQATTSSIDLELEMEVSEIELHPEKKKKIEKKKPKVSTDKGQYITITPPKDPTPPKKAKFVARYNSSAKKQMKRKRKTVKKPSKTGNQTDNKKGPKKASPTPGKQKKAKKNKNKVMPKKIAMAPAPPVDQNKVLVEPKTRPTETKKPEFQPRIKPGLLMPSTDLKSMVQNHMRMRTQLPSDDYIKNVPEGPEDRLNAKYNKHWYFFERVKQRVRQRWKPAQVYRQRDPRGKIHGIKDRYTVLHVTLNKKGELIKLKTMRGSGVKFLDAEARRAFRAAAPFPNPSKGLANRDGLITFKFGFMFEISTSKFRTFWRRI